MINLKIAWYQKIDLLMKSKKLKENNKNIEKLKSIKTLTCYKKIK